MPARRVIRTREDFAGLVREARRSQGLSQDELGQWASLHRTYVSGLETAQRNPSLTHVIELLDALGFDFVVERRGDA